MKPVILIDVDDTIIDNSFIMKEYIKEATNGTKCDIAWFDYNFRQFSPSEREYIFEQFKSDRMYQYCRAYDYAVHEINILKEYFTIIFVTASNVEHSILRLNQLQKLFSWVTNDDIIHTKHKHLIKGDIIIDDSVHNILSSSCGLKLMVSQEWNEDVDVEKYENVVRIRTWKNVADYCINYLTRLGKFNYDEYKVSGLLNTGRG